MTTITLIEHSKMIPEGTKNIVTTSIKIPEETSAHF